MGSPELLKYLRTRMKFKALALINSKKIINVFVITDRDTARTISRKVDKCEL